MISTRLRAFYNPFIGFLPQLGLAALLLVGGRKVIDGSLTLGEFTAFYGYLLMLLAPVRTLGWTLGLAQRATASGARLFELLDREPRIIAPRRRRAAAGRLRPRRAARRDARLRPGRASHAEPALRDVSLTVEAGTNDRARRRDRLGQDDARAAHPAPVRPDRRRACSSTAPTCARVDPHALRAQIAVVNDDPFLFSATVHENIAYARGEATPRGGRRGGAARAGPRLHRARCPTATTPASASAA